MLYTETKFTSSGYDAPEVVVVEVQPEGTLAMSLSMTTMAIDDMGEWTGWEE